MSSLYQNSQDCRLSEVPNGNATSSTVNATVEASIGHIYSIDVYSAISRLQEDQRRSSQLIRALEEQVDHLIAELGVLQDRHSDMVNGHVQMSDEEYETASEGGFISRPQLMSPNFPDYNSDLLSSHSMDQPPHSNEEALSPFQAGREYLLQHLSTRASGGRLLFDILLAESPQAQVGSYLPDFGFDGPVDIMDEGDFGRFEDIVASHERFSENLTELDDQVFSTTWPLDLVDMAGVAGWESHV